MLLSFYKFKIFIYIYSLLPKGIILAANYEVDKDNTNSNRIPSWNSIDTLIKQGLVTQSRASQIHAAKGAEDDKSNLHKLLRVRNEHTNLQPVQKIRVADKTWLLDDTTPIEYPGHDINKRQTNNSSEDDLVKTVILIDQSIDYKSPTFIENLELKLKDLVVDAISYSIATTTVAVPTVNDTADATDEYNNDTASTGQLTTTGILPAETITFSSSEVENSTKDLGFENGNSSVTEDLDLENGNSSVTEDLDFDNGNSSVTENPTSDNANSSVTEDLDFDNANFSVTENPTSDNANFSVTENPTSDNANSSVTEDLDFVNANSSITENPTSDNANLSTTDTSQITVPIQLEEEDFDLTNTSDNIPDIGINNEIGKKKRQVEEDPAVEVNVTNSSTTEIIRLSILQQMEEGNFDATNITVIIADIVEVDTSARRKRQTEKRAVEVSYTVLDGNENVLQASEVTSLINGLPAERAESILGYPLQKQEIDEAADENNEQLTTTSPDQFQLDTCWLAVVILGSLLGICFLTFVGYLIYESEREKKQRKKEQKQKEQVDLKLMTEKDRLLKENGELRGQVNQLEAILQRTPHRNAGKDMNFEQSNHLPAKHGVQLSPSQRYSKQQQLQSKRSYSLNEDAIAALTRPPV